MGIIKKLIAGAVTISLVAGAGYAGLQYVKKSNEKTAIVVPVSSLLEEYYTETSNIEGNITTNVSQVISVSNDIIVEEVYVYKDQEVKKGEKLVSFDTTLVKMELEIAKLKRQQLEQDLATAQKRLYSLQNGGKVTDEDSSGTADNLTTTTTSSTSRDMTWNDTGRTNLAAAMPFLFAEALIDPSGDYAADSAESAPTVTTQDLLTSDELVSEPVRPSTESGVASGDAINPTTDGGSFGSVDDIISGGGTAGDSTQETPIPVPSAGAPTPTPAPINPLEIDGLTDGDVKFYETLDYNSVPYTGTGTEEDPFVFLCSSQTGAVNVLGSFFNRMAGYSEDGGQSLYEGGYWYVLEFHKDDVVADADDRKASAIGYYFVNGSLLEKPVNPFVSAELTVADALKYPTQETPSSDDVPVDPGYVDNGGGDSGTTEAGLTRAEAIKIQQQRIKTLELSIKESDIELGKLEKKASQTEVFARIDGIVSALGDITTGATSSVSTLMRIKSKEGYYLTGSVSELMRDKMQAGTVLKCSSYYAGNFDATVMELSDYPVSGTSSWGYSDSNPNVSNYRYTAEISDQSLSFSDYDWITVSLEEQAGTDGLIVSKSFVRSENGNYFVYKAVDGVLKKQFVQVDSIVNSGYSVKISAGLSQDDLLAFPYGDSAVEGTKIQEGTMEDLYNM